MPKGVLTSLIIIVVLLLGAVAIVMLALKSEEEGGNTQQSPVTNSIKNTIQITAVLPEADLVIINSTDYTSIEGKLQVIDEAAATTGKCLFLEDTVLGKPAKLTAKVTYKFKVEKAGEYKIWIRHFWKDECGNSLFVTIDGGERMLFGDDGTVNIWRWPPALRLTVDLEAGEHVMEIIPREDGLKIDQIILTTDDEYYPHTPKK